ncbi:hypothetical protein CWC25_12175 [Pseudoalteromonas sp. S4389]|uniref:hypothetical protein n=1 Tax=Pseudoalteromonas sp. S4389 TaxID=579556 RepID=UPI001108B1E1|nr:hypothetical protein [Pseudoalteromonas sp. S4389]TMO43389.1 hypothetical protein CWC25_12175 [Pseudoalteromonas sp. S4389]
MTASAGAWYRVGTVNVTNGQQSIVGVNTNWQNDVISIAVGDIFTLDAKTWYEVTAVNSDTSLTLDREFEGATQSAVNYAIVRNTSGTLLTRIAGQIAVQFNQKQLFLDELRTWLNSDNAAEELTDSHGVKKQLKTPAQMVRDHDEKLAELDSIHPHPWAIRKVEFEAMRAANNEKYAASGFVHKGKRYLDTWNIGYIDSLYSPSLGSSEAPDNLFMGSLNASASGDSKQGAPKVVIAGAETQLEYISSSNKDLLNKIKLPPAEDGTRTYDSATGISVTHATSALAFAAETATNKVVTDRVDMWGFEAFLREINDSDPFVYKNGLIQSLASSINGVATVNDNVRPITYFAWYEGDTTSRGKGVNWQTATEAQRIAIASDPENNIYFDDSTGKFYQWCIRSRSFSGSGNGNWESINSHIPSSASTGILGFIAGRVSERILPQGFLDTPEYGQGDTYFFSQERGSGAGDAACTGVFTSQQSTSESHSSNGQCYFLVCGTINRLNQGVYHPSFNLLGSGGMYNKTLGTHIKWYQKPNFFVNKSSCFQWGDNVLGSEIIELSRLRGSIAGELTRNGRPDGRFYDAVYPSGKGGVCRDMRYSAWGLTAEDFAEEDLKIKSGEYRGREVLLKTKFITKTVTVYGAANYTAANAGGSIAFPTSDSDNPRGTDSPEFVDLKSEYWLLAGDNGNSMIIERVSKQVDHVKWPFSNNAAYLYGSGDVASEFNSKFPAGTKLWIGAAYPSEISVVGEFTHTEIIGVPAEILLCDDLKDGWVGSWNPTIPNGIITNFPLTKPANTAFSSIPRVYTSDNGATWFNSTVPIVNNSTSGQGYAAGYVGIYFYKTKAKMTTPSAVTSLYGPTPDVNYLFTSMDGSDSKGRLLNFSLTGLIQTHTANVNKIGLETIRLDSLPLIPSTRSLWGLNISAGELRHHPLSLDSPSNNSSAFKAVNYNVAKNQQGFIQYAFAQLTYDGTAGDWGDDSKIHIAGNQTTMLDENGHTNLVGTACSVEPLGWLKNDK